MPAVYDHTRFIQEIRARFPRVAAEIDESGDGLLHVEMGTLERMTLEAYDAGDSDTVRRHFDFAEEVLQTADEAVLDALDVSFVEGFAWGGERRRAARRVMPKGLQARFDDLVERHDHASGEPPE